METMICTCCKRELEVSTKYFNKSSATKNGFKHECKKCRSEKNKQRYEEKKDYIKNMVKIYALNNRETVLNNKKIYRQNNIEKIKQYLKINKERTREYYKKNRKIRNEKRKIYKLKNREHILQKDKEYRELNKESISKKIKLYKHNNLEKLRIDSQKRRTLKRKLPSTLTTEQWDNIKQYFDNKCCYCGKELPLTIEHFIPVVKKGEYTINNIIPCCQGCNSSKHTKDFFEWYPKQSFYNYKREQKILKYLNYNKNKTQQLALII